MLKLSLSLLFLSLFFSCGEDQEKIKQQQAAQAQAKATQDSLRVADSLFQANQPLRLDSIIEEGEGMFQALEKVGVGLNTSLGVINAIKDYIEMTSLRVGDEFSVEFRKKDTLLTAFEFRPHPALIQRITRDSAGGEWKYNEIEKPTVWKNRLVQGIIEKGSSIDQSLRNLGIPGYMVGAVNGVLLCKISVMEVQPNDTFRVILSERFYEGTRIEGRVLYTNFKGRVTGEHEAWRYDDGDPKSSYTAHYTADGEALIHSGLRYPVDRLHISSGYGMRIHPVTGRRKMHTGVDYAARTGTPVYAVAPGKVVKSHFTKYGGNTVAIRHADGYISYYLHLSRRSVNAGQQVRSRQLIGKVGATGRVTGPHLHFAFKKPSGKWMNPLRKRMIATPKLTGERLKKLQEQVKSTKVSLQELLLNTPFPTPMPDSIRAYRDSVANALADSLRRDSLARAAK